MKKLFAAALLLLGCGSVSPAVRSAPVVDRVACYVQTVEVFKLESTIDLHVEEVQPGVWLIGPEDTVALESGMAVTAVRGPDVTCVQVTKAL